ncbi:MAG TPA: BatD family protein [Herbaspirillum sp.]|jgi:hypothetical protein
MKNMTRILAALLACGACLSAMADVTATLDKNQVALGDTVQLSVQNDGNTDGQLNIEPLKQDFDVLGSSHGTSIQIINGSKSTLTQIALVLAPKHTGTIKIAPLQWGAQRTAPLELTVGGGNNSSSSGSVPNSGAAADAGSSPVFLTAAVDQKQPYVQAATLLTVKLYVGAQIERASLDLPGNSDVSIQQLGGDRQSSEVRNGRTYQVIERQYILLPQRSGRISLKGPVLDAQIEQTGSTAQDSFFANIFGGSPFGAMMHSFRPFHLTGDSIDLNVLPRPAAASGTGGTNWLPAQQLTLEETWQPAKGALHAGEPLTRHLHLTAVGLTGAQLPDLGASLRLPDGVKMYPDQVKIDNKLQGGKLLGSRDQDIALIAANPGRYVLPAIKLSWWDTAHKVQREADLPSRALDVLPAVAVASVGQAVAPAAQTPAIPPVSAAHTVTAPALQLKPAPISPAGDYLHLSAWQWLCIVLVVLWIGTLLAWRLSRRRKTGSGPNLAVTQEKTTEKIRPAKRHAAGSALSALAQACRDNDAQAARRALLAWAAGVWPDAPPRGINALAERLDDARVADLLKQLDRACYIGAAWKGASLAEAFETPPHTPAPTKNKPALPGLYADD